MGNPIVDRLDSVGVQNRMYQQGSGAGLQNNGASQNYLLDQALQIIKQIQGANNPVAMMQSLMMTSPQLRNIMAFINQNGGDAKGAFYTMARQKGIDPNRIDPTQILQMLSKYISHGN